MLVDPVKFEIGEKIRWMREHDQDALAEMLSNLSEEEAKAIQYDWQIMGRREQIIDWEAPENEKYSILFCLAGRGWGKLLSKDEEILTTDGWKTIGEIQVGDKVFDEQGLPCNVLDYFEPEPSKVYEIEFDTGERILADSDHLWTTWTHRDRKCFSRNIGGDYPKDWTNWEFKRETKSGKVISQCGPTTKTTQEIVDTFRHGKRGDLNHSIPLSQPLQIEHKPVPVDPYILGFWIGDGATRGAGVTTRDYEVLGYIESCGYEVSSEKKDNPKEHYIKGILGELKSLGVIGNKHIPDIYSNNSVDVRLQLLRGLMDSDGYIDPTNGVAEFCQKNKVVADTVRQIVASLGEKVYMYYGEATLNGKSHGTKYRVFWRVNKHNPFMLERKRLVAEDWMNKPSSQKTRTQQRMMKGYKEVEKPECGMRCLTVDSESRLFLVGRTFIPTHNTRTGAEFIRDCIVNHGIKNLAIIGPTSKDVRNVMVLGPSGILAAFPPDGEIQGEYSMGKSQVVFNNGATVNLFSSESQPDSIRGGNYGAIWGDEIIAWSYAQEFFDQAMFTLRMNPSKMLLTSTGKATPLVLNLLKREGKDVKIIRGHTYDNKSNLSKAFIGQLESSYEGTRLGKQEMGSEILLESDTALWQMATIMRNTVTEDEVPKLEEVVVSVDPAMTHGSKKSDETGVLVIGMGEDGLIYVLGDYTKRMSPDQWSSIAIGLYDQYSANNIKTTVVVERNQGGSMLTDVLQRKRRDLPIETVFVTASKYDRGVAPSLLGEQNKVKFVKEAGLEALQEELVTYDGTQKKSPNRFDSFSMGIHHLKPVKKHFTKSYEMLL